MGDKLDIFSLGVMLFTALFRSPPFNKAVSQEDKLYKLLCNSYLSGKDTFFRMHPATRRLKLNGDLK